MDKKPLLCLGTGMDFDEIADIDQLEVIKAAGFDQFFYTERRNQPRAEDEAIAEKAAKLVRFCDSFNIPVVTLVDSEGIEQSADERLAPSCARLAAAYLDADCAMVSALVGKAYGASYVLLGTRALGADIALATEGALISTMPPESAVAFVWNDKITNSESREDIEAKWNEEYANAELAAANGDIDDVVAPEELRARICAALYMLASKADGIPSKKHTSMSL